MSDERELSPRFEDFNKVAKQGMICKECGGKVYSLRS